MAQIPQIPIVNAGLLYVNGLVLSNDSVAPNTLLNVSAGAARNSTNINDITLPAAVQLNINAKGLNGLDTGTLANNTLYTVYAIASSPNLIGNGQTTSAVPAGVIMSLSNTTPTLPRDYDMFRRIGQVRIDTAAIRKFLQTGTANTRVVSYDEALPTALTSDAPGTSVVYTAVLTTQLVPAINTEVKLLVASTPSNAVNSVNLSYSGVGAVGQAVVTGDVSAVVVTSVVSCPQKVTAGVGAVFYKVVASSLVLSVAGYVDTL